MNPWSCFESFPGLIAVPAVWRAGLAEHYHAFKLLCLESQPCLAQSFPCPRECGCFHRVNYNEDGTITATCACKPPTCEQLTLTLAEVTAMEVNRAELGRAICKAFGLDSK